MLEKIKAPSDVKKLTIPELEELSADIRKNIIDTVDANGGHLSPNLGAVELTVALYRVFDFPTDKLIFDVGHQCYTHKILGGRKEEVSKIRQSDGVSGFPMFSESVYDAFGAGHAGSSVSACLGYCAARDARKQDYTVIDVVGDASLFNGENLEALACNDVKPCKLIIILNDNGMSISRNNNGMYKFFSKMRMKKTYGRFMNFIDKTIGRSFIGRWLKRFKKSIKVSINNVTALEALGFKYVGVFDGNNMKEVVNILENVKNSDSAILLHLRTKKGKGMPEAENDAEIYHGVGKNLDICNSSFSCATGEIISEAAEKDNRITAICAGMKDGTGLRMFAEKYPDRFFDVGIAEEHAVTFAAGQAAGGLRPIVCVYSTFLQRAYDQIMQDVCIQNLPVIFMVDRAGAVGHDGVTHQGVFDLSYLGVLPNMTVIAPKDSSELKSAFEYAQSLNSPCAIRYPNGKNEEFTQFMPISDDHLWEFYGELNKNVIIAVGPRALKAAVRVKRNCPTVSVINARVVKPLDEKVLKALDGKNIITVEENSIIGGFGSAVDAFVLNNGINCRIKNIAFSDDYIPQGSVDEQLKAAGIIEDNIMSYIE